MTVCNDKIKSAFILVPHQDDELNVAGCLIPQMVASDIDVSVCFVTNGDYEKKQEIRAKEAGCVAKLLGINSIIYLGYSDGGMNGGSLYCANDDNEIVISPTVHSETYGVKNYVDFHFEIHGCHAEYTRNNLLSDIKEVLLQNQADLLICVDMDIHPDHKLTSELFDKALLELIQETDYRPIVLKKFAYLGTWHGKPDYFVRPMQPMECASYGKFPKTSCEPHNWNNRIRFAVPKKFFPLCFWKSPLFKAYKIYSSQWESVPAFLRVVNSDAVYWYLDSNKELKESSDFPIERCPFLLYEDCNFQILHEHKGFCFLFFVYWILFCRIPRKFCSLIACFKR